MNNLSDGLVKDIEYSGVHPQVVLRVTSQALGVEQAKAWYVQTETTLDGAKLLRHVTVALLTDKRLLRVHVDDDATQTTAVFDAVRLADVKTHAVSYVYTNDNTGELKVKEAIMSLNWQTVRRVDLEPATCGDVNCAADHGYTGSTMPDDFNLRVSTEVEGDEAVSKYELFIEAVSGSLASISEKVAY
ncbi:DUF5998 family protein [Boudabousia marimammalium]|uniref:Uncharacterized protein n=1 Tax=Boudabousia marimammalium TaxID=156892 RepID=A0A1Q5PR89_9ACTO|nr:DUF5998 family protein [Boudabousia marimammalium]OKL49945.1 hypothetical protein BM477_03305 [Boudabousia marimammalium]